MAVLLKAQELLRFYGSLASTTVGLPVSILVNIGAIASIQSFYLPDALANFHQQCPQRRTRAIPGLFMELFNLVDARESDMAAITRTPFSPQCYLRWTTLELEPYRLIVPRDVPGEIGRIYLPTILSFTTTDHPSAAGR